MSIIIFLNKRSLAANIGKVTTLIRGVATLFTNRNSSANVRILLTPGLEPGPVRTRF